MHGNTHSDDMAVYEKFIVVFLKNSNSRQKKKKNQETLLIKLLTSFSVAEFIFHNLFS
jgi:hypothetical protein